MMFNKKNLCLLENEYNNQSDTFMYVVYGNRGLGKTYTINEFLSDKKNVLRICFTDESAFALEPVVSAISSFSKCSADSLMLSDLGLNFKDVLLKQLLSLCHNQRMIIYFENLANCERVQIEFLINFLKKTQHADIKKPFVILELDSNVESSNVTRFLDELATNSVYIQFETLSKCDSKEYIEFLLKGSNNISKKSMDYITEAGCGNLTRLNIIVNYLKRKQYITLEGSGWICDEIPNGELIKALTNNIMNRYESLSKELQSILQKAGIVGMKFDSVLIEEIFDVLSADEQFYNIEESTSLVHCEKSSYYYFENYDVHKLILRQIKTQDQHKWIRAIIDFYKNKLSRCTNIDKSLVYSYKLASYFKDIAKRNNKTECYFDYAYYIMKCVVICMNIFDYSQALNYLSELKDSFEYYQPYQHLLYLTMLYEAKCREAIGEYTGAIELYEQCLRQYQTCFSEYEFLETSLDLAYCYYMNGYLQSALEITLFDQEKLNDDQSLLNCKILSFLSSIYHLRGDDKLAEDYYIRSLSYLKKMRIEKEYYIQLKKSSMIIDLEVAKPLIAEALSFFEKNGIVRELAETLHNYYTNDLYLMEFFDFESGIQKSISAFKNYASIMVHYPLNTYGVYLALIKNDIHAAIEQFESALIYDVESFSRITLFTNMASCKMMLGELSESKKYIEMADKLIFQEENKDIVLLNTYHYINWSLYYKAKGCYEKADLALKTCLTKLNIEDRHKFWIGCQLNKIKQLMNIDAPMLSYTISEPFPLMRLLVEKDTFFATMRFYE